MTTSAGAWTSKERVRKALTGFAPDRIPKGELRLPADVVAELAAIGGVDSSYLDAEDRAMQVLGIDMLAVVAADLPEKDWLAELRFWAERDYFVWTLVDGPFESRTAAIGWPGALLEIGRAERRYAGSVSGEKAGQPDLSPQAPQSAGLSVFSNWTFGAISKIRLAIGAGADGIIISDDLAGTSGLLVSPRSIETYLAPLWLAATTATRLLVTKTGRAPMVAFHSDGKFASILDTLVDCGFGAIHSLEPESGMDIASLAEQYRGRLGFMGGFSVPLLTTGPEEAIRAEARRLASAARLGGIVAGSAAGFLPEGINPLHVAALYDELR